MKKEVMHNLVIIALLIVAVGFIFMNSNLEFTGHAIFEGYNETSCIEANYTWENITNQSCNVNTTCVDFCELDCVDEYTEVLCSETDCQESCEENNSSCVLCSDEDCVDEYTEVLCSETDCQEICNECEDIIIGAQCVGDICDSDHLNLCLNETNCTSIGAYWYNNSCNANKQCVPKNCNSLDYECGKVDDGCGKSLNCGSCKSDETCKSGVCKDNEKKKDNTKKGDSSENKVTSKTIKKTCVPKWECNNWSDCVNGTQNRTCLDIKKCNSKEGIPKILQSCEVEETCFDGVMNQNEKGIDCGGICEEKCSIFTIVGSVINGPIESSKEFILQNKIKGLIVLGFFALLAGGVFAFKIFFKRSKKQNKKDGKFSANYIAEKIWDVTNI